MVLRTSKVISQVFFIIGACTGLVYTKRCDERGLCEYGTYKTVKARFWHELWLSSHEKMKRKGLVGSLSVVSGVGYRVYGYRLCQRKGSGYRLGERDREKVIGDAQGVGCRV